MVKHEQRADMVIDGPKLAQTQGLAKAQQAVVT